MQFPLFGPSKLMSVVFYQWFGNIVTMDWWDDLWLNEGFASFFEYIGVDKAESSWGMVSSPLQAHQSSTKLLVTLTVDQSFWRLQYSKNFSFVLLFVFSEIS